MNFITKLSLFEGYNVICIIIYRLIKKYYYVLCH